MIVGPRYNDSDPAVEAAYQRAAEAEAETASRIDAIAARLEAATPGPWESEENFSSTSVRKRSPEARLGFRLVAQVPWRYAIEHRFVGVAGHPDDDECTHRTDGTDATYCGLTRAEHDPRDRSDADLIAHAPADLAALLSVVREVAALAEELEQRPAAERFTTLNRLRTALAPMTKEETDGR